MVCYWPNDNMTNNAAFVFLNHVMQLRNLECITLSAISQTAKQLILASFFLWDMGSCQLVHYDIFETFYIKIAIFVSLCFDIMQK
jgi:hypothetical protein